MSQKLKLSPRRVSRGLMGALVATAAVVATTAAVRPVAHFAPGWTFRVSSTVKVYPGDRATSQDAEVMRGRGTAVGGQSRIEFLAFTPTPPGLTTDDFLIMNDSGHVFLLKTNGQVNTADDTFGGPAPVTLGRVLGGNGQGGGGGRGPGGGGPGGPPGGGGANRGNRGGGGGGGGGAGGARGGRGGRGGGRGIASGFLNQVELLDVKFNVEKLGDGEVIDGRPTKHMRITTDYRILWGDQSIPAHAVTEIWSTPLPTDIPNPFEPLLVADQSTDGPLIEYALKLRAVRRQVEGTAVRVITTTTLSDVADVVGFQGVLGAVPGGDKPPNTLTVVQQTEIRNITAANVDPKLVMVPENPGSPNE